MKRRKGVTWLARHEYTKEHGGVGAQIAPPAATLLLGLWGSRRRGSGKSQWRTALVHLSDATPGDSLGAFTSPVSGITRFL
jgi:hypothetical protein